MYQVGDRVQVTIWEEDSQHTMVTTGAVEEVCLNNEVIVLMDNGERRQLHVDEIEKIGR